jgi:hypothetical protein
MSSLARATASAFYNVSKHPKGCFFHANLEMTDEVLYSKKQQQFG